MELRSTWRDDSTKWQTKEPTSRPHLTYIGPGRDRTLWTSRFWKHELACGRWSGAYCSIKCACSGQRVVVRSDCVVGRKSRCQQSAANSLLQSPCRLSEYSRQSILRDSDRTGDELLDAMNTADNVHYPNRSMSTKWKSGGHD